METYFDRWLRLVKQLNDPHRGVDLGMAVATASGLSCPCRVVPSELCDRDRVLVQLVSEIQVGASNQVHRISQALVLLHPRDHGRFQEAVV